MKDKASQRARRTPGQNEASGELDICIDLITEIGAKGCRCKASLGVTPNHPVSKYCHNERCSCGVPATHKIGEEIFDDDPNPIRHNLTAYVCCFHFRQVVGPACGCGKPVDSSDETFWQHGFKHGWSSGLRHAVKLLKTRWRRYQNFKT